MTGSVMTGTVMTGSVMMPWTDDDWLHLDFLHTAPRGRMNRKDRQHNCSRVRRKLISDEVPNRARARPLLGVTQPLGRYRSAPAAV
jgi:hypothetical protein